MKNKLSKIISILVVTILTSSTIFIQGCSMQKSHSALPSEVLIMDLNDKPEYQELLSGPDQTCGMRSGRVYLKPGETCGVHSTEAHEEMLIFLSGKGVALIGPQQVPYEVSAGQISYIPPYTVHNNKNTGTEPLIYIYCVTPIEILEKEQNSSDHDHDDEQN